MKHLFILFFSVLAFRAAAQSDTMLVAALPNKNVNAERKWGNDTLRYNYNQMRYYVTTVMPYVTAASQLFNDLDHKKNSGTSHKDWKKYVASREKDMRSRFEDQIDRLNTTQGVLLIKLIARQTGLNIYDILQETKGDVAAVKFQVWARFNGFNLNKRYDPSLEPNLEHIMNSLGYPLPERYSSSN